MTEFVRKFKYSNMSDEEASNINASLAVVCLSVSLLFMLLLNEIGVFYVEPKAMRMTALIGLVLSAMPIVIIQTTEAGTRSWFKYFVMICIFLSTLAANVLLAFHATLMIVAPIIVSLIYYDKKMHRMGLWCSLLVALLAPLLSCVFDSLSMDFWLCLLYANDKNTIDVAQLSDRVVKVAPLFEGNLSGFLVAFCGLPQVFIVLFYGVIMYILLRYRLKNRDRQLKQIEAVQSHVLYSLSDIIENRDMETGGHVRRARDVVEILVSHLYRVPQDENPRYREYLVKASITHDIGKIAVDDDLLRKTNRVTEEEYEEIKIHPNKSAQIIDAVLGPIENHDFVVIAKNLAKYHHERFDGTGYPEGLKGTQIPLEARIMAIADVFDALITERCYREMLSYDDAYNTIKDGMGTQFDPELMEVFDRSYVELIEYYERTKAEKVESDAQKMRYA